MTEKEQPWEHSKGSMLRLRSSSMLLRGLTAAAVPAMASCFILSGPSIASGVAGRAALAGPLPSARPFISARQVRRPRAARLLARRRRAACCSRPRRRAAPSGPTTLMRALCSFSPFCDHAAHVAEPARPGRPSGYAREHVPVASPGQPGSYLRPVPCGRARVRVPRLPGVCGSRARARVRVALARVRPLPGRGN